MIPHLQAVSVYWEQDYAWGDHQCSDVKREPRKGR